MMVAGSSCLEMGFFHFTLTVEKLSDSESWIPLALAVCAESLGGIFPGTALLMRYMVEKRLYPCLSHLNAASRSIASFSVWS